MSAAAPLVWRMIGFIRHLRDNGFVLGSAETQDALGLVQAAFTGDGQARRALKVLLTGRREEWQRFDALFEAYWHGRGRLRLQDRPVQRSAGGGLAGSSIERAWQAHLEGGGLPAFRSGPEPDSAAGEAGTKLVTRIQASARERLWRSDLRDFADPAEMAAAEALALRLARAFRDRLSRRHRQASRGTRLDLRRTIRASIRHGGEPLELYRRRLPERPVRLVVFLDVSGSMEAYSRFFLQFLKGIAGRWIDSDAYLIHTKLIRVTDLLRERDGMKAMTRLALLAEGFGGGTKLGEALAHFNRHYGKRALKGRSVVLILSDGFDTGSPALLAAQLARLQKRARRLVWLNPLLGWRDYQPVAAAMRAALPHIDHFAAANTLEALAALEPDLARL